MAKDTDHDKVVRLEEKMDALKVIVYEIKDNHLAHLACNVEELRKEVKAINIKMAGWVGAGAVLLFIAEKIWK